MPYESILILTFILYARRMGNAGAWDARKSEHLLEVMHQETRKRNLAPADAVFVDIGANVGWFTLLMLAHGSDSTCLTSLQRDNVMFAVDKRAPLVVLLTNLCMHEGTRSLPLSLWRRTKSYCAAACA